MSRPNPPNHALGDHQPTPAPKQAPSASLPTDGPGAGPSAGREDAVRWLLIVQRISNCGRRLRRWLSDEVSGQDCGDGEFLLLLSCSQATRPLTQRELALATGSSQASVSNQVERLRTRGLLAVNRDRRDRRLNACQTTPAGDTLLDQLLDRLAEASQNLQRQLGSTAPSPLTWLRKCEQALDANPAQARRAA